MTYCQGLSVRMNNTKAKEKISLLFQKGNYKVAII